MTVALGHAEQTGVHWGNHASATRIGELHLLGLVRVNLPNHTQPAVALQLYEAEWGRHMALMRQAVAQLEQDAARATQAPAGQPAPTGGPP